MATMRFLHHRAHGCDRARSLASAGLDGMLADTESAELRRHLRGCPDCQAVVEAMTDVTERVRNAPEVEAPRLLAPVPTARAPRRRLVVLARGVGAAAAAAAIAAALVSVAARPHQGALGPPQSVRLLQLSEPARQPGPSQRWRVHHQARSPRFAGRLGVPQLRA
jgi:ferric-dicitrate binding protein FerR (iron transport regulator)